VVLEVDVDGTRRQFLRDPGQGEVVGRDEADGASIDEAAKDAGYGNSSAFRD